MYCLVEVQGPQWLVMHSRARVLVPSRIGQLDGVSLNVATQDAAFDYFRTSLVGSRNSKRMGREWEQGRGQDSY